MKKAGLTRVPGWKQEDMEFFWKSYSPIITWVPSPHRTLAPAGYDLWVTPFKSQHSAFYVGDAPGNVWLNEAFNTFDPYEYCRADEHRHRRQEGPQGRRRRHRRVALRQDRRASSRPPT